MSLTLWEILAQLAAVYQLLGATMRAGFGKFVTIALFFGFAAGVKPAWAPALGLLTSGPAPVRARPRASAETCKPWVGRRRGRCRSIDTAANSTSSNRFVSGDSIPN